MIRGWCFVPGKPIVRGYDSSPLFREDCLERIRQIQLEVQADMRELTRMRREHDAANEQLRQRKKECGWIDEHSLIDTRKANGGPGVEPPLHKL